MIINIQPFADIRRDKVQALKPLEEAAEVYAAWQDCETWATELEDFAPKACAEAQALLDECMDVLQATVNLVAAYGYTSEQINEALVALYKRNLARGRNYQ